MAQKIQEIVVSGNSGVYHGLLKRWSAAESGNARDPRTSVETAEAFAYNHGVRIHDEMRIIGRCLPRTLLTMGNQGWFPYT